MAARIPQTLEAARQDVYTIGLLQTFLDLRRDGRRDERSYWADVGRAKRQLRDLVRGVVQFCLTHEINDLNRFVAEAEAEVSMRGGG